MFNVSNAAKLNTVRWDAYKQAAFNGQIASTILLVIATVALAIIFATHQNSAFIAANHAAIVSLTALAGTSFTIFIICSCMHCIGMRKLKRDQENKEFLRRMCATQVEQPEIFIPIVTASQQQEPIAYISQAVITPLLGALQTALAALVRANGAVMSYNLPQKMKQIEKAFAEARQLFDVFLNKSDIYVNELLCYFGPKKKLSNSLRRLIGAFNSGDTNKYHEMLHEHETILLGYQFDDVATALKTKTPEELMHLLPALLANHFALPDNTLKELGIEILTTIFEKTRTHPTILSKLKALRNKKSSFNLPLEIKELLKLIHKEAKIPVEQYNNWSKAMAAHILQTWFKNGIRLFLDRVARNIHLLEEMFNINANDAALFIKLDTTYLLSESSDCIKRKELQFKMYELQTQLNTNRSPTQKIALIALDANDRRDYPQLKTDLKVVFHCFQAHPNIPERDLHAVNENAKVKQLGQEHSVRLVAVPTSLSEHIFKKFRQKQRTVEKAAAVISAFGLNDAVKSLIPFVFELMQPSMSELLPQIEKEEQETVNRLIKKFITILIDPVYDGAVDKTTFRPSFENVIKAEGKKLAAELERILANQESSYEEIVVTWVKAMKELENAFQSVAINYTHIS